VRAAQSCVGNFDWVFAFSFAVSGKEKESKKQERKVVVVSITFFASLAFLCASYYSKS
jgi:hypothetical protein